jgi:hypothetical protein
VYDGEAIDPLAAGNGLMPTLRTLMSVVRHQFACLLSIAVRTFG